MIGISFRVFVLMKWKIKNYFIARKLAFNFLGLHHVATIMQFGIFFSLQFNNLIPRQHGPQSIKIMYAAFNIEKVGTRLIIINPS